MAVCNANNSLEGENPHENYQYQYLEELEGFLGSGKKAFIPGRHRDVDRYNWHIEAEKRELVCITLRIWRKTLFCDVHRRPIFREKDFPLSGYFDYSEYVQCKGIEDDSEDDQFCIGREATEQAKLKTAVIFNKETSEIVKTWDKERVKNYLVELGVIQKTSNKYWV